MGIGGVVGIGRLAGFTGSLWLNLLGIGRVVGVGVYCRVSQGPIQHVCFAITSVGFNPTSITTRKARLLDMSIRYVICDMDMFVFLAFFSSQRCWTSSQICWIHSHLQRYRDVDYAHSTCLLCYHICCIQSHTDHYKDVGVCFMSSFR